MKGTRFRGQIRSESPDTTGPDPGGNPPKTAVTTHSQIRRSGPAIRLCSRTSDQLATQARPFIAARGITAALRSPVLSRPLPYQADSGLQSMPRDDSE
jgi:hypothetical protein